MAFSCGRPTVDYLYTIQGITEWDIALYYLNLPKIPCIINSPLREDKNPSFGICSPDGNRVFYTDFATKDRGGLTSLLSQLWNCSPKEAISRVEKDLGKIKSNLKYIPYSSYHKRNYRKSNIVLQCRTREWRSYDLKYWESYGVSLAWLQYAEVYPISHKIIIKDNRKYVFSADKYAYAFVEHKENNITLKIYQPFNKLGYKWCNKHDKSVISLWTKVPEYGEQICICSSLKDALCLWSNTGIPSLAIQGEGYEMSNTAISELKRRYKHVYILLDNDEAGLKDGIKLSASTGFTNLVLPYFEGGKDISDLFKSKGKDRFLELVLPLFQIK